MIMTTVCINHTVSSLDEHVIIIMAITKVELNKTLLLVEAARTFF